MQCNAMEKWKNEKLVRHHQVGVEEREKEGEKKNWKQRNIKIKPAFKP